MTYSPKLNCESSDGRSSSELGTEFELSKLGSHYAMKNKLVYAHESSEG